VEAYGNDYSSVAVPKVLVLPIHDAELWYIAPNTVLGVTDGKLDQYTSGSLSNGGGLLRDDRLRLIIIADSAIAWYGRDRSAVSIALQGLQVVAPVGGILNKVSGAWQADSIGTIITSRTWDWERNRTILETDYWQLNIATAPDIPGLSDLRSVGRAFRRLEDELTQLSRHAGNLPVRSAIASGRTPLVYEVTEDEDPSGNVKVKPLNPHEYGRCRARSRAGLWGKVCPRSRHKGKIRGW